MDLVHKTREEDYIEKDFCLTSSKKKRERKGGGLIVYIVQSNFGWKIVNTVLDVSDLD